MSTPTTYAAGPYGIDVRGWVGLGIVVLFIGTWLIAMLIYRLKHYEQIGFSPSPASASDGGGAGWTD